MNISETIWRYIEQESRKYPGAFYSYDSYDSVIYDNNGQTVIVDDIKGVYCREINLLPALSFYYIPYNDPNLFYKLSSYLKEYSDALLKK